MKDATHTPIEELLAALHADDPALEQRRSRSWSHVRSEVRDMTAPLRLAAPTRRPHASGQRSLFARLMRPLAFASAAAVATAGLILFAAPPQRALAASVSGEVRAVVEGHSFTVSTGDALPAGASIETAAGSWIALRIGSDRLTVDASSSIVLSELSRFPANVVIDQIFGRTWNVPATDASRRYVVRTSSGEAIARGTAFLVSNGGERPAEVITVKGEVEVKGTAGSALTTAGQRVELSAELKVTEGSTSLPVTTDRRAVLADALGRTCSVASVELPGCVATEAGFVIVPELGQDLSIRVEATEAGTLRVTIGDGAATEIALPNQGTFEIEVEVEVETKGEDGELKFELKVEVEAEEIEPEDEELDDEDAEDPDANETDESEDEDQDEVDDEDEDQDEADDEDRDEDESDDDEVESDDEDESGTAPTPSPLPTPKPSTTAQPSPTARPSATPQSTDTEDEDDGGEDDEDEHDADDEDND